MRLIEYKVVWYEGKYSQRKWAVFILGRRVAGDQSVQPTPNEGFWS